MCTVLSDTGSNMARRSKNSNQWGQRDILTQIARPVLLSPPVRLSDPLSPLVEDRRTYNPLGDFRPPLSLSGGRVSIEPGPSTRAQQQVSSVPSSVAFSEPDLVNICARRKQRREVLAAKRLFKKGSGAGKRRRNFWSDVGC